MNDDLVAQNERGFLGSILRDNSNWSHTAELASTDFSLSSHTVIYGCMAAMFDDGKTVDTFSLSQELDRMGKLETVGCGYPGTLFIEAETVLDVAGLARSIKEASTAREWQRQYELLGNAKSTQTRIEGAKGLQDLCKPTERQDGRALFHTHDEFVNAPKLDFAIDGFLQEGSATCVAALPGNAKTWFMLAMVRSLLTGEPLFGHFDVTRRSERVLYLIPESTIAPFWKRIQLLHLEDFVRNEQLLIHTLSAKGGRFALNDPRLSSMAAGNDIFIDTVARYMSGGEDIEDARELADSVLGLLGVGARTITAAHHSPKAFETAKYMCLENVVRGSGDLGASFATVWGMRQIDPVTNRVYVQNVKPRDFEPCGPFVLEGRPHIDLTGCFKMIERPGDAKEMSTYLERKGGRPSTPNKDEKIIKAVKLREEGKGLRESAEILGVSKSTVERWLFDYDSVSQN